MTLPAPQAPARQSRWVALAQEGDVQAREELAGLCQRMAFSLALQLTGNRDDALDLTQDAMVRFFRSLDRFDRSRPVRPWLMRIVRNLYRDRLRRRRIRKTQSLDEVAPHAVPEPVETSPGPEFTASRRELQRVLWDEVQRLAPHYREVVVLRDYQDLEYAEIARVLRIPRGTVMSRLHRARKQLAGAVRARLGHGAVKDEHHA